MPTSVRRDRPQSRVGPAHLLAAAAILGLLVMPVAFAAERGPGAAKSASLTKQLKKLKRRVAALEARRDQVGQVPASLPPSGPAGGALTGTYPNPLIANNAVTTPKIADDAVNSAKVLDNALGGQDIDESSLGTVPSATSATNATSADTVDGLHIHEIGFASLDSLGTFLTIFNKGGLQLEADCDAGPDIQLRATTSTNNAYIRVTRVSGTAAATDVDTDFDVLFPLALGGTSEAANYNLTYLSAPAGIGGNVVFATFTAEETNNVAGSATDCFVRGRALSNAP